MTNQIDTSEVITQVQKGDDNTETSTEVQPPTTKGLDEKKKGGKTQNIIITYYLKMKQDISSKIFFKD